MINNPFSTEERLIIAIDPPKERCSPIEASHYVEDLLHDISGVGDVIIKVNSALRGNYSLLEKIKELGFRTFADLKLSDIPETMERDGLILRGYEPDFITVMCSSGRNSLQAIAQVFEGTRTEILGVTVLTSMNERDCRHLYNESDMGKVVLRHADVAFKAGINGLVCSTHEIRLFHSAFSNHCTLNIPEIRPSWYRAYGHHKGRAGTPAEAIHAGATRIIVGRPITEAHSPHEAVEKILEEIRVALNN